MSGGDASLGAGLVPHEWLSDPPESLVVGDGPYALALALIMGTASLPFGDLEADPRPNHGSKYPRVFEDLKRAFMVLPPNMPAAEAVQCHAAVWTWVEKLASTGDQHQMSIIFVVPREASLDYERALAIGIGVSDIHPETTGHAVWRRSGSLSELLEVASRTRPMDFLPLHACRAADARHSALATLRAAVAGDDSSQASEAVRQVLKVFLGHEYQLDVFCRTPSHLHGNLLRGWLHAAVTGGVTSEWLSAGRKQLPGWLIQSENSRTR